MASSLVRAGRLKPEIRLAQAISEFKAALPIEEKKAIDEEQVKAEKKAPDIHDVIRVTAEFNQRSSRRRIGGGGGARCFGTRLSNVLEAVQQFASIGDIIIGGSQNLIACGVWSLVRFTLLSVVAHSAYVEKLTHFYMDVGVSAPRYQRMAVLYPQSKELQAYFQEYFIVVVQVSQKMVSWCKKSKLGQMAASMTDSSLALYQVELEKWATCVKEEIGILASRSIEDQSISLRSILKNSAVEKARRQRKTANRLLDACSTYDYQTSWKEIRKIGNSNMIHSMAEYQDWKSNCQDWKSNWLPVLICAGKLGSGKSVCMANIVDDLNLSIQSSYAPVAYFFCRHDISASLQSQTIMSALCRQLLQQAIDTGKAIPPESAGGSMLDFREMLALLQEIPTRHYWTPYLVIDGLDECDKVERDTFIEDLKVLHEGLGVGLHICLSLRLDAGNELAAIRDAFQPCILMTMPDENPDISDFIHNELTMRLEREDLVIADPALILEIHDTLLSGAEGMFLWVSLQIMSLCAANTDDAIRSALADLPKNLPTTFARILASAASDGNKDLQMRILELLLATRRLLTIAELREALSVIPGDTAWKPGRLPNNMPRILACCGSLVTVDEEGDTVRLVHHSVKQYLLQECYQNLTWQTANINVSSTVITYLNHDVFTTQLQKQSKAPVPALPLPVRIIHSAIESNQAKNVALNLLQRRARKGPDVDVEGTLRRMKEDALAKPTEAHPFYAYATVFWQSHAPYITSSMQPRMLELLLKTVKNHVHGSLLTLAIREGNDELARILIETGVSVDGDRRDEDQSTPLIEASRRGSLPIVDMLLSRGANTLTENAYGRNAMVEIVFSGFGSTSSRFGIQNVKGSPQEHRPVPPEVVKMRQRDLYGRYCLGDRCGISAAAWVAALGTPAMVQTMFAWGSGEDGEDLLELDELHQNRWAPGGCHEYLSKWGMYDLMWIDELPKKAVYPFTKWAQRFMGRHDVTIVDFAAAMNTCEATETLLKRLREDTYGERIMLVGCPLTYAIDRQDEDMAKLLAEYKTSVHTADEQENTPLIRAAGLGWYSVVQRLINVGAVVEAKNHEELTALDIVCGAPSASVDSSYADTAEGLKQRQDMADLLTKARRTNSWNKKDVRDNNYIALHYAAILGHVGLMSAVISDRTQDVDGVSNDNVTPLMLAAYHGHVEAVRYLLSIGANVKAKADSTSLPSYEDLEWTPLHFAAAAQADSTGIAEILLDHGANINASAWRPGSDAPQSGRTHKRWKSSTLWEVSPLDVALLRDENSNLAVWLRKRGAVSLMDDSSDG